MCYQSTGNKGMLILVQSSWVSGENVQQWSIQTVLESELEKRRCQQKGQEKYLKEDSAL